MATLEETAQGNITTNTALTVSFATFAQNNLGTATIFCRGNTLVNETDWLTAIDVDNTTEHDQLRIMYRVAGASENVDIQVTWTGTDNCAMILREWSGMDTDEGSVLDKTAFTGRTTSTSSISSGTTAALSSADEVAITGMGARGVSTGHSWDNSYTGHVFEEAAAGGASAGVSSAYLETTSTSAQESTVTINESLTLMGCIATFLEAGAAAAKRRRVGAARAGFGGRM